MSQNTFLYTLPQWIIFASVFVTVYGWVENKKAFRIIGISILVLLGFYALYILSGDFFASRNYLTPEEIMSEEIDEEIIDELPFQARLFPAYVSFLFSAILGIPALYFELKNKKIRKLFILVSGIVALLGFFIIVGALKTL